MSSQLEDNQRVLTVSIPLYDVDQPRTTHNPASMGSGASAHSPTPVQPEQPSQPDVSPDTQTVHDSLTLMQQSLNRSVTLVVWYKSGNEPVRLTHEVSTFPLFRLASLPALLADLELSEVSYVDTYNSQTGTWEQHTVSTVRAIQSEQRLLYKIRKSLLSGLADSECPGVEAELALQPGPRRKPSLLPTYNQTAASSSLSDVQQGSLKRLAPDSQRQDAPEAKRMLLPEGFVHPMYIPHMNYMFSSQPVPYPHLLANPSVVNDTAHHPPGPIAHAHSVHHMPYTAAALAASQGNTLYPLPGTTHAPPPSASSHHNHPHDPPKTASSSTSASGSGGAKRTPPHPPQKRWPNDYTVSELSAGLARVDALVGGSASGAMTQRLAFERVFGCRYVKSTVCRHRGLWRRADPAVKRRFEEMAGDEKAIWGEFVRAVEGRAASAAVSRDMDVDVVSADVDGDVGVGDEEQSGAAVGAPRDDGEEDGVGEDEEERAAEQDQQAGVISITSEAGKPISLPLDQRSIPGSGGAQA
ncbi:hypothetical protein CONPUDRAFT_164553 [Coniophora puteana RWD-64-598 SS2]|uniref:Uncharacterized protein n=1 Tax=Coniophora puteana (strain RWD-64-598) TaxID=741705 RepID=A0A5M3MRJ1_CONPW|nr:uncharacterized protein CONPUDRAFT_164553 [Coniophora puteana RWD-64-598 SS2]EIW81778.1 hypothetical protein CONPUDRAFT_164553 [Coniophora puteana RWD-64-598 SS2]